MHVPYKNTVVTILLIILMNVLYDTEDTLKLRFAHLCLFCNMKADKEASCIAEKMC